MKVKKRYKKKLKSIIKEVKIYNPSLEYLLFNQYLKWFVGLN